MILTPSTPHPPPYHPTPHQSDPEGCFLGLRVIQFVFILNAAAKLLSKRLACFGHHTIQYGFSYSHTKFHKDQTENRIRNDIPI